MAWTLSGSKQKQIDTSVGRALEELQVYFNDGAAWRMMQAAHALMEAAVAAEGKEMALSHERYEAHQRALEDARNAKYYQELADGAEAN